MINVCISVGKFVIIIVFVLSRAWIQSSIEIL